ncbi:MAG: GNAT family N-acetyltransferase [Pseudomonadota bacterium]
MKTSIRTVRASDLPAVVKIDKILFGAESFPSFSMRQFINLFPDSFFVAEQNGLLVGYAAVGVKPFSNDAWLLSTGVLEPHQNRGIGTNLLTSCDDYCEKSRVESCRLTTDPANSGAIRLYKTFGFQLNSELRNYYEPGDRKVMMIKTYDRNDAE